MSGTARYLAAALGFFLLNGSSISASDSGMSQLVAREIQSKNFATSKIGVSPVRRLLVYLPAGYESSAQRYPVIYFLASPLDNSFRGMFDKLDAQSVLDRAIAR